MSIHKFFENGKNAIFNTGSNHNGCIEKHIEDGKIWEPHIHTLFIKYCQKHLISIEGGAHIGTHTIKLAELSKHVHVFEPFSLNRKLLIKNIKLNNMTTKVTVHKEALFDKNANMKISTTIKDNSGSATLCSDNGESVRCIPLDSLNIKDVGLIKLDIEGCEKSALKGALVTIEIYKPIIILEDWVSDKGDVCGEITTNKYAFLSTMFGYKIYHIHGPDYIFIPQLRSKIIHKNYQRMFSQIHQNNVWSVENSSGGGVMLKHTDILRKNLTSFLKNENVKSILDIGCGDPVWIMNVLKQFNSIKYSGWDLVEHVVDHNKQKYPTHEFKLVDALCDDIPQTDVIICRNVMNHLSSNDILTLCKKIFNKCKYVILSHQDNISDHAPLTDNESRWRALNMRLPPFHSNIFISELSPDTGLFMTTSMDKKCNFCHHRLSFIFEASNQQIWPALLLLNNLSLAKFKVDVFIDGTLDECKKVSSYFHKQSFDPCFNANIKCYQWKSSSNKCIRYDAFLVLTTKTPHELHMSSFARSRTIIISYQKKPRKHVELSYPCFTLDVYSAYNELHKIADDPYLLKRDILDIIHNYTNYETPDLNNIEYPLILHRVWLDQISTYQYNSRPKKYLDYENSWNYFHDNLLEIKTWGNSQIIDLIIRYFGKEILQKYNKLNHIMKKADVARMIILYVHGGIYADLDFECTRPMFHLLKNFNNKVLFVAEPQEHVPVHAKQQIFNGFVVAKKQSPFIKHWINTCLDTDLNICTFESTGPIGLTKFFEKYSTTYDVGLICDTLILPMVRKAGNIFLSISEHCEQNITSNPVCYADFPNGTHWSVKNCQCEQCKEVFLITN